MDELPAAVTPRRNAPAVGRTGGVRPAPRVAQDKGTSAIISFYRQILDIETVCANALRSLRQSTTSDEKWLESIAQDDWMYKFDVPVKTTF